MRFIKIVGAIILVLVVALPFVVSACAPAPEPTPTPAPAPAPTPSPAPPAAEKVPTSEGILVTPKEPLTIKKVGAMTTCSKFDYSWGASNYRATMMLEDLYGVETMFIDCVPFADQAKIMTDYAEAGCDVIIAWGYEFIGAAMEVAPKYPDIPFLLTCAPEPGSTEISPNIASMYFREEEGGYLCGVLAASVTKTKHVAYMSGTDLPCVTAIGNGFRMGAYAVDPDVEVDITYVGSWIDVAKERELASAEIDAGADILFSYAIGVGIADVIEDRTTEERPVWFIGSQFHDEYKPDVVIATHYLSHMKMIKLMFDDLLAGTFVGHPYKSMLENGIIEMKLMDRFIPDVISLETRDKVEEAHQAILSRDKVVSRLVNVGIQVMPDTWPAEPVANIGEWLQPGFEYVFEGNEDPYYYYLR